MEQLATPGSIRLTPETLRLAAPEADVIVLGSRPRTNLRRLILGSVSSEVVRRASCEVVVVPG